MSNKRGRIKGRSVERFVQLPLELVQSREWRALSGATVKFLIELAARYNGFNNGDLSLTRRDAEKIGLLGHSSYDSAVREACEGLFVLLTRKGGMCKQCNLYSLTWKPLDDCNKPGTAHVAEYKASNQWKQKT